MALETLKNVKEIGGFKVYHNGLPAMPPERAQNDFISVNHKRNSIEFKIQNGAIKENGVNGCQVDTIIETAKTIIEGLDINFPSPYNKLAMINLNTALKSLQARKTDRVNHRVSFVICGVEGYKKQ